MPGITANHGYLKGIVIKELAAGRKCEITGGILIHIDNHEDYDRKKENLWESLVKLLHANQMVLLL